MFMWIRGDKKNRREMDELGFIIESFSSSLYDLTKIAHKSCFVVALKEGCLILDLKC